MRVPTCRSGNGKRTSSRIRVDVETSQGSVQESLKKKTGNLYEYVDKTDPALTETHLLRDDDLNCDQVERTSERATASRSQTLTLAIRRSTIGLVKRFRHIASLHNIRLVDIVGVGDSAFDVDSEHKIVGTFDDCSAYEMHLAGIVRLNPPKQSRRYDITTGEQSAPTTGSVEHEKPIGKIEPWKHDEHTDRKDRYC
jgi:hypothetical protein